MKTKFLFNIVLIFMIFLGCNRESTESYLSDLSKNNLEINGKILPPPPTNPNDYILGVVYEDGICYDSSNNLGKSYKYYVTSSTTENYDRIVYSIYIKDNTPFTIQPLIIPANSYVSNSVYVFNNLTTKLGDIEIKINSVYANGQNTYDFYEKKSTYTYIDNCFIKEQNCYDQNGVYIDNNKDGTPDCFQSLVN